VAQATIEAQNIIQTANRRAEESAGEALEAVRDAKRLEATAPLHLAAADGTYLGRVGDRLVTTVTAPASFEIVDCS
jgi:F0F1-type ATP synthase membrane subunit b/b'